MPADLTECYPPDRVDLIQMNRILRHRLRNLSCGIKMALGRIDELVATEHPEISGNIRLMCAEMDRLEQFTHRMDWLFAPVPGVEPRPLFELVRELRERFTEEFPHDELALSGFEADLTLPHGNWLAAALWELTANAAEASDGEAPVQIEWTVDTALSVKIRSRGDSWPEDIPFDPPQPFATHRGRHDGLGLAIARRIVDLLEGSLTRELLPNRSICITLTVPCEETRE